MAGDVVSFTCRQLPPKDWPDVLNRAWSEQTLAWSRVTVDLGATVIVIEDDEGHRIPLDCSKSPRPSGQFVNPNWKVMLTFLRVAQAMRFDVVLDSSAATLDSADVAALRSLIAPEMRFDDFEEAVFAVGLVPRAFRLRQLGGVATGIDVSI
jgi:hypothetical protein